ncbi:MAG: phosphoribosyl-AMP cyclohydrolase [Pseudomonadota bacterium]|nr:phosphoribosyl-AMP cyclohydrolase [Pseudomonadota bacterium]
MSEATALATAADWLDAVRWDGNGLVPVVAQEVGSNDILMFAWMDRAALQRTAEVGEAVYWSRSRQRQWKKGEESGNVQRVRELRIDCDGDVVLLKVEQTSRDGDGLAIACHTGRHSCFYRRLENGAWQVVEPVLKDPQRIYT